MLLILNNHNHDGNNIILRSKNVSGEKKDRVDINIKGMQKQKLFQFQQRKYKYKYKYKWGPNHDVLWL